MPRAATVAERFNEKVDQNGPLHPGLGTRCWVWTASLGQPWGYGQFYVAPKMRKAHRVSWELHVGPVPDGLLILHRCDNPPCIRPDHLFLGTNADNRADMDRKGRDAQRRKTHCPEGHAYTPENTMVNSAGQRSCRICNSARSLAYNRLHWRRYAKSRATGRPKGSHERNKTHCKYGHPFDIENTHITADGKRRCRACDRDRYHAKKAG